MIQIIHDIFFESIIDVHQLIGTFSLLTALFGLYMSYSIRRSIVFKIKLITANFFLLCGGLGGIFLNYQSFHMTQHILNTAFIVLITILYWREVRELVTTIGNNKNSLCHYFNDIPDLIWIKDSQNKYVYVNKAAASLFNVDAKYMLQKTDSEINSTLNRDPAHTFNLTCTNKNVLSNKSEVFVESGYFNDEFIAIQVVKSPVYSRDRDTLVKKYAGCICIGREITNDILDHKAIEELLKSKDVDAALKLFMLHKNKHYLDLI